jgi:hypothetical protein
MDEKVPERWIVTHARQKRGHRTVETLDQPGRCETCGARSPGWWLVELSGQQRQ